MRNKLFAESVIILLWTALCAAGIYFAAFSRFENQSFDLRAKVMSSFRTPPSDIKIITVDQASLNYLEQNGISWPWHRSLYGLVLEFLTQGRAKGVALDILFTEARLDRPDDDAEFITAVKKSLPSIFATKLSHSQSAGAADSVDSMVLEKISIPEEQSFHELAMPSAQGILLPIPGLVQASNGLGNVTSVPDIDGVFRHYRPLYRLQDSTQLESSENKMPLDVIVPGLPVALALRSDKRQQAHDSILRASNDGRVVINYYGPGRSFETIPFATIFDSYIALQSNEKPTLAPDYFKDSYIFMGFTAPGLHDHTVTPLSHSFPGVEVNATVLANLLDNSFIVPLAPWAAILIASFWIALAVLIVFHIPSVRLALALLALGFSLNVGMHFLFYTVGYWSPQVVPQIAVVAAILSAFVYQYTTEGRERRFIKSVFSHYLSGDVIETLLEDPSTLQLGGRKAELSIFFSDIQGFTGISEQLDPSVLVELLNEYLTLTTNLILDAGGTLDKYLGDAILCFWNAPIPNANHATAAVQTALNIQEALKTANPEFEKKYGAPLTTRIGIHTGGVTVGNFGSEKRFDYTIIGDAANLASRLEGLNKVFGTYVLVSETTKEQCDETISFRLLGHVQVVGKTTAVRVYEPKREDQGIAEFETAYRLFEDGEVLRAYNAFKDLPADPVAHEYCKRIEREGLLQEMNEEFSPVWVLKSK